MNSRDYILAEVKKNQPEQVPLPNIFALKRAEQSTQALLEIFSRVAEGVGSRVIEISSLDDVKSYIRKEFNSNQRLLTSIPELYDVAEQVPASAIAPHQLENVEFAVLKAEFAVAENGAMWVTEAQMGVRVLPFICQHLALVVKATAIVADMHAAYSLISDRDYDFATFIAGPSKTADIEQSLVLGAHGPRSLTVFIEV